MEKKTKNGGIQTSLRSPEVPCAMIKIHWREPDSTARVFFSFYREGMVSTRYSMYTYDVTQAIFVYRNKETEALLMFQIDSCKILSSTEQIMSLSLFASDLVTE